MSQMSKSFQNAEQKKLDQEEQERDEARKAELKENTVYFFARASKYKVANWVKEIKGQNGNITQPESSLGFEDNLFITDDPAKIKHIRESKGFIDGHLKECNDLDDAIYQRTMHFVNVKGQRRMETEIKIDDPTKSRRIRQSV